eukprot:XP_008661598.1 uncharacterized protein LOC100273375 isoform X2 [Zea mays]
MLALRSTRRRRQPRLRSMVEEVVDISNWEKKEVCGKKRKLQSFRDEEYYISSVPQNHHLEAGLSVRDNEGFVENRLDAAVLDLVDDEASGMQAQKTRYHWMKVISQAMFGSEGRRPESKNKVTQYGLDMTEQQYLEHSIPWIAANDAAWRALCHYWASPPPIPTSPSTEHQTPPATLPTHEQEDGLDFVETLFNSGGIDHHSSL